MKKKKMLVVMPSAMDLGGVERSLIGLLETIDPEKYSVDLFIYGHHGPLFVQIPANVNLLPEVKELAYLRESFGEKLRHGCFVSALLRMKDAALQKFGKRVNYDKTWAVVMRICAPRLKKQYDLALGFFLPFDFLSEKVDAKVKLGWIHTDYSSEKADWDSLLNQYNKVDYIIAVSQKCGNVFAEKFPQLRSQIRIIENILPEKLIRQQALEEIHDMPRVADETLLLSVGRFSHAKNFDNVPWICKKLLEAGVHVKWYLIGYGPDENLIRSNIIQAGMEEHVIVLGKRQNPYPYIAACDLYVQPSRYEGKAVTVREAQMLGKPVVITRYATSSSQLEDGVDGLIVPMDNEGCAEGIAALLADSVKMECFAKECAARDYANVAEIEKITVNM